MLSIFYYNNFSENYYQRFIDAYFYLSIMRFPIQLEAIVFRFINDKIEFLLLKRIPEKGEFWQPVSGGFESEDLFEDGFFRELQEETGIKRDEVLSVAKDIHFFQFEGSCGGLVEIKYMSEYVWGFEVSADQKVTIEENIYPEHSEYKWCSFEEALELLKWDNNKDGFRKLNEILTK